MCVNEYISTLYHIFMEELPEGQQIPREILDIILYRYGGLANTKMIECFNEFKNKTFNVRPATHTFSYPGDTYLDQNFRISVNTNKIDIDKYMNSKKIRMLMLSKMFKTRMKNDMREDIFGICFQGTTHYSTSSICRYTTICKARYLYLLRSPVKGRKISLICKLLLAHYNKPWVFSEHFLEGEISRELNLDIDRLTSQNLSREYLINLYIGSGDNISWVDSTKK